MKRVGFHGGFAGLTLQKKWRMAMAASRKVRNSMNGICDCGKSVSEHKFVAEITGMQCTLIYRCADGELTTLVS